MKIEREYRAMLTFHEDDLRAHEVEITVTATGTYQPGSRGRRDSLGVPEEPDCGPEIADLEITPDLPWPQEIRQAIERDMTAGAEALPTSPTRRCPGCLPGEGR